ncbi:MAG: aminotransferase class I/II-fold pyridoxal phosphate-dependent enzyme, partial [bacterium]|nr:aminotransferase class I/II-fold pyridoxal phosphate-dependent enzyme [bacterium]
MVPLSKRVSSLRPSAVNSILAEVRELRAKGRQPVSLMRGQPDFSTPPHIVEAAYRAMREGRTGYPDNRGEAVLREAVAEKLSRDNGLTYDAGREILVTTGATLGLQAALGAVLSDGDEVLLPDPVYDAYRSQIAMAGGRALPVRSRLVDGRFELDAEALDAAWTPAAKVLLLNTPWNPVGTVFQAAELKAIAEFVER